MTREEAIAVIIKEAECVKRQGRTGECCRDDLGCGACDLVEKDINIFAAYFLAIEALKQERPKGEWIEQNDNYGDPYYECSVCEDEFITLEGTPKENHYNFCPNCGADMREEGEAE